MKMLLSLSKVKKEYIQGDRKIEVLSGLDLNLESGNSVAILGQSGSGKSTLLSLLSGVESPTSGSYDFDGIDFVSLPNDEKTKLRSTDIGIIFQQFHLLPHLTAFENVLLPLEIQGRPCHDSARKLLESVGLSHRMDHFPEQLSGGEKQRVAIARAMIIKPKLLLADEPSGSLDEETGLDIMKLIFSLVDSEKSALILVTHNKELAKRCGQVKNLVNGQLS